MKAAEPKEKKRGFWKKFYNFLAYGGITKESIIEWTQLSENLPPPLFAKEG
jgi:hypothetical protein